MDRLTNHSDRAQPAAWRAPVNPFGQKGWEYADTEQELIDRGIHNREPLYLAHTVIVKPLEWTKDGHAWIAIVFWGLRYRIHETPSGKFILRDPLNGPEFFDTLEAAKAAAQADYERHIHTGGKNL